eukprot:54272-Ditylum_brightwellii.AAC.1
MELTKQQDYQQLILVSWQVTFNIVRCLLVHIFQEDNTLYMMAVIMIVPLIESKTQYIGGLKHCKLLAT